MKFFDRKVVIKNADEISKISKKECAMIKNGGACSSKVGGAIGTQLTNN